MPGPTLTGSAVDFAGVCAPPFPQAPVRHGFDLVIHGGEGDCARHYSGPAAEVLRRDGGIARLACVDPRPASGAVAYDDQFGISEGRLPLPQLAAARYLKPTTVHLVSAPNHLHAAIVQALQAAGCTHIGLEKPLMEASTEAEGLLGTSVFPVSHQLAKAEMMALIQEVQAARLALDSIAHCVFTLLETDGIPLDREVRDVVFDMHWHGFEALVVPLTLLAGPQGQVRVTIEQVHAATYADPPPPWRRRATGPPPRLSASWCVARARDAGTRSPTRFARAKGCPRRSNSSSSRTAMGRRSPVSIWLTNPGGRRITGCCISS